MPGTLNELRARSKSRRMSDIMQTILDDESIENEEGWLKNLQQSTNSSSKVRHIGDIDCDDNNSYISIYDSSVDGKTSGRQQDDDENVVSEMKRYSTVETRRVQRFKMIVLVSIFIVGCIITSLTFLMLNAKNETDVTNAVCTAGNIFFFVLLIFSHILSIIYMFSLFQYNQFSIIVEKSLCGNLRQLFQANRELSDKITSDAISVLVRQRYYFSLAMHWTYIFSLLFLHFLDSVM